MFNIVRKKIQWGNSTLILETGRLGRQADGAVLVTYGDTTVLCTVVGSRIENIENDFLPLTINYQEKSFSAGKIPGGFFKREGRPSDHETLVSRMIDRPIRPLFHPLYRNETQIVCTVLSYDEKNSAEIVAMIGASAALTISGLPFLGPIAAARIGYKNSKYLLNPSKKELQQSDLDLVIAATSDGVIMVESQASELSEEIMLNAMMFGHQHIQPIIELIIDLAENTAKEPRKIVELPNGYQELVEKLRSLSEQRLLQAYSYTVKKDRSLAISNTKLEILSLIEKDKICDSLKGYILPIIKNIEKSLIRHQILKNGKRIDGRKNTDIRPIDCEVSIFPKLHGSALFTRGETQTLAVTTLGTNQDQQIIDALDGEYQENFILHYNFPSYSVGEIRRITSPTRREIGHGKLAWRSLKPLIPNKDIFPYTTRIVSEVTESNGSSSMATVCASALALMDAGVPISRSVAGIAMGLIQESDTSYILSDIMGDEDHLGDMDLKIAGTIKGITALQMDLKIPSISPKIMHLAMQQALKGRLQILESMNIALSQARDTVSSNAPSINKFSISKDKIRNVIGSGGKTIREICEETGAKIDIEDDGKITVAHTNSIKAKQAIDWIKSLIAEPELNHIYNGKVVKTVEFGAFVNFFGPRDGLVHISELTVGRVKNITDIVKEGDKVKVKVIGYDDRGKIKLSMKRVNQESGLDIESDIMK